MIKSPRLPLLAFALALSPAAVFAQAAPAAPSAAAPAAGAAQLPPKQVLPGIGIVNRDEIIAASNAFRNANSERQIVYKNQIAMAEARRKQINAELQPLVSKYQEDQRNGNVAEGELQQQAQTIQAQQRAGVQELQGMLGPISRSETYVIEQVTEAFSKALVSAMDKRGITLVMPSSSPLAFNNAYIMSGDVLAELNTILPRVTVVPPDSWQPRAEREAAAQQAQQAKPAASAPASRRRN